MGATTYPRVVGLTGLARAGKSTAASYLAEIHGYQRVRFSGPLKDMLRAIGLTDRHIEGDLKEVPCDLLCGSTPRWAMQSLGTEWRNLIGTRLWSNIWLARAQALLDQGRSVVAEDVRFPHEVAAICQVDGFLLKFERPGQGTIATSRHASEAIDFLRCDFTLINDGDFDHLYRQIDQVLRHAFEVAEAA